MKLKLSLFRFSMEEIPKMYGMIYRVTRSKGMSRKGSFFVALVGCSMAVYTFVKVRKQLSKLDLSAIRKRIGDLRSNIVTPKGIQNSSTNTEEGNNGTSEEKGKPEGQGCKHQKKQIPFFYN